MPKEYIDYGIANQADMLFNSNFPDDRFPKERGIVIEEIKMSDDTEGAPAEDFFAEKALQGTPYSRPILGYESNVANIPRQAVVDYYKRFYAPNNMIALIIGDFDRKAMKNSIQSIFGQFPRVETPPPPEIVYKPLKGKEIYRIPARTKSTYINYSIEAPHYLDSSYYALTLLEDYLSDRENSPLISVLKSGSDPLATSVSVYLDTKQEFSRLNIEIITEKQDRVNSITDLTDEVLEQLSSSPLSAELLNGYKVSRRCNEIYLSEKLHFYGFVKAPLLAITGWDFFNSLDANIDLVSADDIVQACHGCLDSPNYIATVVYPHSTADHNLYKGTGLASEEIINHFKTVQFSEYNLETGKDFKMPVTEGISISESKHASYLEEVLPNGMKVIIKFNPDSRVFAMNVIGRNRSATEPVGKDGITDFVNRMIEKGTTTYNAEQLSRELSSIGAKITLYDNPWLPHDDRYTTRRYSFMKFETIDEFTSKGIKLFADMITNPTFDSTEMEKVRAELFGILGRNSGSTYKNARKKFYGAIFEGTPYAKTINGNYRTTSSISTTDLKEHHRKMYSPENMIVTVGTNQSPPKVMAMLKEELGKIPTTGFTPIEPTAPVKIKGVKTAHEKMDKEQVYIYLGNLLPSVASADAAALKVAGTVLSGRLQANIRERQGLAYSVGSSAVLDKEFGWLICSMGTGAKNFKKAKKSILAEIERLKTEPPSHDELETAINSIWGSYLTGNLSLINQAYYMGVYEYLGLGYRYGDQYINNIRQVTAEQVSQMAEKYFDTENYVIATAGNI